LNDEKEEEEKEWDGLIVLARLSGRTSKKKKPDTLSLLLQSIRLPTQRIDNHCFYHK
jgi:hypothetical protein